MGRTTGVSGQTEDSVSKRFLWNYYNQTSRSLLVQETGSWSYSTGSWRAANNNTNNRVQVVVGIAEAPIRLQLNTMYNTGTNKEVHFGIAEDGTSTPHSSTVGRYSGYSEATNTYLSASSSLRTYPTAGFHYYQWVEISQGSVGATIFGSVSTVFSSGLSGEILG